MRRIAAKLSVLRYLIAVTALTFCGQSFAADANAVVSSYVTEKLSVWGEVENKLDLSVDDLQKFPPQQLTEVPLQARSGTNVGKLENVKGVRLRDILEKAQIIARDHNDVKKTIIIATASDNYKVVYSWSEVFNSPVGDGVLVYFSKNDLPLQDEEGRIAMISTKDLRTGPRHVRWLQSIEVRRIAE